MATSKKNNQQCPYWSEEKKSCSSRKDGLTIPLENHIFMYCTTAQHINCPQYQLEEASLAKAKDIDQTNRRASFRFKNKLRFNLVLLKDSAREEANGTETAEIIDLSAGGMQISTVQSPQLDSCITFSFAKPVFSDLETGLARVRWCKYSEDVSRYSAGLSFETDEMTEAINNYLHATSL